MKRLGLIARHDQGGLASQTWEVYRHLHPDKTLVVNLGQMGRGAPVPGMYGADAVVCDGYPDWETCERFLAGLDVVFSCEGTYGTGLCEVAAREGVEVVVQVNPELYHPDEFPGARPVVPTTWEAHRVPGPQLPVPINRAVLPFRKRTEARVFYHPMAPAMMDRNGTEIVLRSLVEMGEACKVIVRGSFDPGQQHTRYGEVEVEWRGWEAKPYYELYPPEADVLLLPRRYGGLCLPVQEAASLGMPVVAMAVDPCSNWPHAQLFRPSAVRVEAMKGGEFDVWDGDPRDCARALEELVRDPALVERLSVIADAWAGELSWDAQLPGYEAALR